MTSVVPRINLYPKHFKTANELFPSYPENLIAFAAISADRYGDERKPIFTIRDSGISHEDITELVECVIPGYDKNKGSHKAIHSIFVDGCSVEEYAQQSGHNIAYVRKMLKDTCARIYCQFIDKFFTFEPIFTQYAFIDAYSWPYNVLYLVTGTHNPKRLKVNVDNILSLLRDIVSNINDRSIDSKIEFLVNWLYHKMRFCDAALSANLPISNASKLCYQLADSDSRDHANSLIYLSKDICETWMIDRPIEEIVEIRQDNTLVIKSVYRPHKNSDYNRIVHVGTGVLVTFVDGSAVAYLPPKDETSSIQIVPLLRVCPKNRVNYRDAKKSYVSGCEFRSTRCITKEALKYLRRDYKLLRQSLQQYREAQKLNQLYKLHDPLYSK